MSRVLVILAEGFEESEAIVPIDVLRRGDVEVVTAALADDLMVPGAHGIKIAADTKLVDVASEEYDLVLLPGGPGTERLRHSELVLERVRRQRARNGYLAAICAAPLVLVDAGVLDDDQHVTCYPSCVVDLDRSCAGVPVVVDGGVITGQAPGAALLFGLVVLQVLEGEGVAQRVARAMVTDVL